MSILLAYCSDGKPDFAFHESLMALVAHDAAHDRHIVGHVALMSGPNIAGARNEMTAAFLTHPDRPEWMLMIDTDMSFMPELAENLLAQADPTERPIVGGLCFGAGINGRVFPTMYRFVDPATNDGSPVQIIEDFPDDSLCRVDATGAACLLIHRSVLEKIGDHYPEPHRWFAESVHGTLRFSEDWTFCVRAGQMGFPVYVHTGIEVGHCKTQIIGRGHYEAWRARKIEAVLPFQTDRIAVEDGANTAPTFVVIPVKDRHDMTQALIEQLGDARRVFIYDNGSAVPARDALSLPRNCQVIDRPRATIHENWNAGIRKAAAECGGPHNVAILNNDLLVEPDMLTRLADGLRSDDRVQIVYPNWDERQIPAGQIQLTQGAVATGGMCGFAFMLRGETGLTFDEQYEWWCGDNDIELTARAGGGLVACVDTPIKHLEPNVSTERSPERQAQGARDIERFKKKWGSR